ncbi:histidinol-phosphate transaminase [Streptomyces malaysiensis]|uniref:histidinol-phosphate transaminase n=1 Tax=Streptomyces malaysiensis TaxID=92644 RepID=UPI002B317190|nr:histidinol-phosphate transaminase [Streptomyces malaysiensis]
MPRLRAVLGRLAAYQPTEGVHAAVARTRPLSANESPHGPLPGIVEAIAGAASVVNRYPDPGCGELTRAIARTHGITEDRVVVGAGSVALLQTLLQSVGDPGTEVVYAWRSFELYPTLADLAGLRSVRVPLVDDVHDLPAMADRITDATRLVLICNPNNPTGTVVAGEELRKFLARVPPTCLVALDEAYYEYAREPTASSGLDLCAAHPNLVVLRTFSKAYGLAGLRVGYLVGDPRVVEQLRKACLVYAVNGVAQQAAVAALGLQNQLLRRVDATVAERGRVRTPWWPMAGAFGPATPTSSGSGWAMPRPSSASGARARASPCGRFRARVCACRSVAPRTTTPSSPHRPNGSLSPSRKAGNSESGHYDTARPGG